jgi:hypothetical protein
MAADQRSRRRFRRRSSLPRCPTPDIHRQMTPEASELAPGLRTDRIGGALEELRLAALSIDVVAQGGNRATRRARAALSRGLEEALKRIRRALALAEITVDGSEPEVAAAFLILDMDTAAVHLIDAARSSLSYLRAGKVRR